MTSSSVCVGTDGGRVHRRCRTVAASAALSSLSSGRRSTMSTSLAVVVLLVATAQLHPVGAFSTHRQQQQQQQQLERLLGGGVEGSEVEETNHVSKRESKGTCTCTCETRPVASTSGGADSQAGATSGIVQQSTGKQAENRVPETAALIRTAASMKDAASRSRQQQPAQQQQASAARTPSQISKPQSKAAAPASHRTEAKPATSSSYGHIVKVPPLSDDYDAIMNEHNGGDSSRTEDQYDDDIANEQKEADSDQSRSSNQDWSVDGSERWPWERLPDTVCLRQHCKSDRNCCRRFNICDKSANVCTDCWHGSTCTSERDCCMKYKYCKRDWKTDPVTGQSVIVGGKCVSSL